MASQQTTRQAWSTATGQFAFTPYDTIRRSAQVPEVFRKRSQWQDNSGRENGYYSYTENEPNHFIPVEFDSEHFCWIEIRWITEPETSIVADHWQAFQIAREELGLDITIEERDQYITNEPSTPGVKILRDLGMHDMCQEFWVVHVQRLCTEVFLDWGTS